MLTLWNKTKLRRSGVTVKEIAARLGVREGTVKAYFHRHGVKRGDSGGAFR